MSRPHDAPLQAPVSPSAALGRDGPAAVGLAVMLLVFGFLFVLQARTVDRLRPNPHLPARRAGELALLIRRQQEARERLVAEVAALSSQVRDYETAASQGQSLADQMRRDIEHYRAVLGLTPLEGPGLVVTVSEKRNGVWPPLPLVQAQDLAGLANELWSAGAEAIAVNGVRVLASTDYREVDGRIVVAGRPLRPPFVMVAIGDPDALEGVLRVRGGFAEGLESVGIGLTIARKATVRVPALARVFTFRYAKPVRP